MRNRFLVVGSMCVLLLSVLGCSTDKSSSISTATEDRQTIMEKAVSETPALEKDNNTDSASPVIEVAKSTEKEIPVESTASETLRVYDLEEDRPMDPESHVTEDSPKEPEPTMPPEDDSSRQEDTVRSEAALLKISFSSAGDESAVSDGETTVCLSCVPSVPCVPIAAP